MTREQFIELVEQEQKPLRRFLLVLCGGDGSRADDIAQEALLKAYLSYTKFEGRSKFSTWLFRIAYNCFYDSTLKQGRLQLEPIEAGKSTVYEEPEPPKYENAQLYEAIGALPEAEKAAVLLFYMEEKSLREIVEITGMNSATLRSHLFRARRRLRKILENLEL